MKLVTFEDPFLDEDRLGVQHDQIVVDLTLAHAALLDQTGEPQPYERAHASLPPRMLEFLKAGERSLTAACRTEVFIKETRKNDKVVCGPGGEKATYQRSEVKLKAPLPRPGKIIHTAGNFREHADEGKKSGWEFPIPQWISYLKSPSAVIGPDEPIVYPKFVKQLDYEIELAIVIGKGGKYIPKEKAFEHIAGYTVFNDITARDIQRQEMKSGLLNFGKNLDTFAPFGPCLALQDKILDPHQLKIELRVNGEIRQSSHTSHLSVTIPEIVEHYSWVTLEPGDIITTGTVSGVAAFRANPEPYWLKPGDVIEAEIEKIGVLRNPVVAEQA